MKKIEISISDETDAFIQARLGLGPYDNVAQYIEALISADQVSVSEELEVLLAEGMDSPSDLLTDDDWADIRKQAMQRPGAIVK